MWITEKYETSFSFGVRSCRDASIVLAPEVGNANKSYLVVIGGNYNKHSRIYLDLTDLKRTVWGVDVLDCLETRYFWISWKDSYIEVGHGHRVGRDKFLDWRDNRDVSERYDVKGVNLYSGGSDALAGYWEFYQTSCNCIMSICSKTYSLANYCF